MSRRVALLLYPGCIFFEIALAAELLARHGCELLVLTPDAQAHAASNGTTLQADGAFTRLESESFDAVLVPGGDPASIFFPPQADAALQAAARRGSLLAGICAGGLVLAHAGLLRGRRATHNYTPAYASEEVVRTVAPIWHGIDYEHRDCVLDGRFITAMPWAYADFAAAVAQALGLLDDQQARDFAAYHRRRLPSNAP